MSSKGATNWIQSPLNPRSSPGSQPDQNGNGNDHPNRVGSRVKMLQDKLLRQKLESEADSKWLRQEEVRRKVSTSSISPSTTETTSNSSKVTHSSSSHTNTCSSSSSSSGRDGKLVSIKKVSVPSVHTDSMKSDCSEKRMEVEDVKENIIPTAREKLPQPYEILFLKTAEAFDTTSPSPPPIPPKPLSMTSLCPSPRKNPRPETPGSRVFVTSTTVKQSVSPSVENRGKLNFESHRFYYLTNNLCTGFVTNESTAIKSSIIPLANEVKQMPFVQPTAKGLDRSGDQVYQNMTNIVKVVKKLLISVQDGKVDLYVDLVKEVGLTLRSLLAAVDELVPTFPGHCYKSIEAAHRVLSKDMAGVISSMKNAVKYTRTTVEEEYRRQLLQSSHILVIDAKHLLDTVDSVRLSMQTPIL